MKYMKNALLIYDEQANDYREKVENNEFGVEIISVEKEQFLNEPEKYLDLSTHLVLSGSMLLIDQLFNFAYKTGFQGKSC